ncbi:protein DETOXIFICATION 48-like [Aristolochia californica]|uniref:protein DETOXIFICATION 48-like n=1 Tax=Aristolochia californica TaxID=171875 RepID=UPI0035E27CF4
MAIVSKDFCPSLPLYCVLNSDKNSSPRIGIDHSLGSLHLSVVELFVSCFLALHTPDWIFVAPYINQRSLNGLPSLPIVEEMKALSRISAPTIVTGLLIYVRNLVSMLFLGRLGEVELAAGALAIGFANITGYSVIFGLAMGMEPICGQAYGAQRFTLLGLTLQRTVLILLLISLPISFLWLNAEQILLYMGQDQTMTTVARTYLLYCIPDLVLQSVFHPLRIYLRTQNITRPIAICSIVASLLHTPLNYLFVLALDMGIRGVSTAIVASNLILVLLLSSYIYFTGVHKKTWIPLSGDCVREWPSFLALAIPSCISICLEWWWYELMILLCGLFDNPEETISAIGILIQITSLVYVFPCSLSFGVSTRVAQELGAGRARGARLAAVVGTWCGVLVGMVAMSFAVWARGWWGLMFTDGAGVLKLTSTALTIVGLCELGNCPQTTMCGVLRGSARARRGATVNLWGFYGVGLSVALALGFWVGMGFVGLWLGLLAAQLSCAVALGLLVVRTDWNLQVKRAGDMIGAGDGRSGEEGDEQIKALGP